MNHSNAGANGRRWVGAALMVAAIVAFFVLREHWGHILGMAPYLVLLACPLMHLFMHGGKGHDHGSKHDDAKEQGVAERGAG